MEMLAMLLLLPLFTHKCQTRASDFARQPMRLYRFYHSAASSFRIRSIRCVVPVKFKRFCKVQGAANSY
uniref:Putative secreted protein n=1 Tax=Ixodes ricinus TaxID=34613 RepID=A0A6B0U1X3_IXORI